MRQWFYILLACCIAFDSHGQSYAGVTGIRDTSYTIHSEFIKNIKKYPFINIAERRNYNYIDEQRNVVYDLVMNVKPREQKRELKLDIFFPKETSGAKRIAIIFIYGGGWRSGDKIMHVPLLEEIAARGYVCFAPDYRLSTEALYPAAVYDIKSAIRWVRKNAVKYNIDVNKILVAGHSSGGELAAFMGATNGLKEFEGNGANKSFSSKVNAVIDLDGTLTFIHPESGEGDDSKKTSSATYWFGYSKTENPELWKQAAPLTHVGKSAPPFLFINSGLARMHAGRDDFIKILNKNKIYSRAQTLEGSPHSFLLFHPWFDTTVVYMDKFIRDIFYPEKPVKKITVAKDGTGNFSSVQAAINSIPEKNTTPVTISIKNGIYKEKIFIDSLKKFITLEGEDQLNTVLTFDDHTGKLSPNGDSINTRTSWSFKVKADNFTAKDITFQNDAGFSAGQAVAMESDGDKAIFMNCRFVGNQDVLFTNNENSRQYFEHCYIEGTTDFIFGSSTGWFEKCRIYSKKNSHVTAAATPKEKEYGYVFHQCYLEGDTSLHGVSLGRPWRPYAKVTYLECYIGPQIKAEGWSNWNNTDNYKTARFEEWKSYGPSSDPNGRVKWMNQLSDQEAKKYTVKNVLGGWNPLK